MPEQKVRTRITPAQEFGSRIALKDAAQLPPGSWVSARSGSLYEAEEAGSLVAVVHEEPEEYILVGEPGKTPYPQMRQRAREQGIEPQF